MKFVSIRNKQHLVFTRMIQLGGELGGEYSTHDTCYMINRPTFYILVAITEGKIPLDVAYVGG